MNNSIKIKYIGYQKGTKNIPGFALWDLQQEIKGHPYGSSITLNTLIKEGYNYFEVVK